MNKRPTPPRLATWWLKIYCSEELLEEIHGDLLEAYYFRLAKGGKRYADFRYFLDVLQFFKPYSFEKHSRTKQFLPMFSNYLKISLRNIIKHKTFTAINWAGLSVGVTSVVIISLYLQHELSYDQSFPDAENIYRLVNEYRDQTYTCMKFDDYYGSDFDTQVRLTDHLKKYEGVAESCHFVPNMSAIGPARKWYVRVGNKTFVEEKFIFTNTGHAFQSVFPQEFLMGNVATAYSEFQTVILTETSALRLFGKDWKFQDILGEIIDIGQEGFEVAGVVADPSKNIHFDFEFIIHQQLIPSWGAYTYFKTDPSFKGSDIAFLLNEDIEKVYAGYTEDVLSKGVHHVALTDIHFTDGMLYEIKAIANKKYLATFGAISLVILLIIWTNYANLSIALYTSRQRELGIRKVMGARSKDVSMQVTFEALILALLCFPFILTMLHFSIPYANQIFQVQIGIGKIFQSSSLLTILGLLLLTGVISSLYPALVYGNKSTLLMVVSKINSRMGKGNLQPRKILMTIQFFMLIGLMSLSIVIMQQMDFVRNKSLGFEREGVVFFDVDGAQKYEVIKAEVEKMPSVQAVGKGMVPGQDMYNQLTYKMREGTTTFADGTLIETSLGSMDVYGIRSRAFESLRNQPGTPVFVINETAAKKLANDLNIDRSALIGKTLIAEPEWENEEFGFGIPYVIGDIISDFDYFSLKYASQPLLIAVNNNPDSWTHNMILRISTNDWLGTLNQLEQQYLQVETERPFNVQFLDDYIDELYVRERSAGWLTTVLTGVCVLLAVMGLIGVVGYVTFTRRKEIGIRKVFGATMPQVFRIIFQEYLVMLVIATTLTVPVAIYLANQWLSVFAYRITPAFEWVTMASGGLTLVIVLMVVVLQSYRTVEKNPTETLRYE